MEEVFVGVVTQTALQVINGHSIYQITGVEFHSLSSNTWDTTSPYSEGHPCFHLAKLLTTGSFYFSFTYDLTSTLQSGITQSDYIWNRAVSQELNYCSVASQLIKAQILINVIQGFVSVTSAVIDSSQIIHLAVVSRKSTLKSGTRFNARGIDDDGFVSNFVETEYLMFYGDFMISFLQIRGSVPVFFEQQGIQVTHKIKLSRGPESTRAATFKHFEALKAKYGEIQIVNLLGQSTLSPEFFLTQAYINAAANIPSVVFTGFDFASIIKRDQYERLAELDKLFNPCIDRFGCHVYDTKAKCLINRQIGVLRTNCLDCLDRTNVVQTRFALNLTKLWLRSQSVKISPTESEKLLIAINQIWADNGDMLSLIYAGTGALKSSYTRNGKQTLMGYLDDATKSVNRFYISNFQDKFRQQSIDILLGKNNDSETPILTGEIHGVAVSRLAKSKSHYASVAQKNILIASYNLNGKTDLKDLDDWLSVSGADLVLIGVQEIIELKAEQYLSSDTEQLFNLWERKLLASINDNSKERYVLLRSVHLVALGMFVFAKESEIPLITRLSSSSVKTGLMGIAANKGGIGVSMNYCDTKLLFITAHLAAGKSAVQQRNQDYWTITENLDFEKGQLKTFGHDAIFWFGDFNYRINLENKQIRNMCYQNQMEKLLEHDQLLHEIRGGNAFVNFFEAPITFQPTYKYDCGTNNFDSSEKARAPAWTDRILYTGNARVMEYTRGEHCMSDHKPIRARVQIDVEKINRHERSMLLSQIIKETQAGLTRVRQPKSNSMFCWWDQELTVQDIPTGSRSNPFYDFDSTPPETKKSTPIVNLMD